MDDRVFKLQDLVAHNSVVNTLKFGPKSGRVVVTGGEDKKVNLWAVGKSEALLSFAGHTSGVDSVNMDWHEELVVAGNNAGTIKLWDLDQAKVIRTLSSHKASVTCVEFHPFGEFFASGSVDLTVRIWDVQRKGCIQTYHGHQEPVRCMAITPDGRWIVTGDGAGVVKIWDMTAGRLLRSLNSVSPAPSPVVSIAFNPSEFMMAITTTDGSVAYYDLQSFEMISKCSCSGIGKAKSATFDPDGTVLLVYGTEGIQVWSWEPPTCLETISARMGDIGDVKVLPDDGKVLAGSKDQNFVGLWGLNLLKIKPFSDEAGSRAMSRASSSIALDDPSSQPKPTIDHMDRTLLNQVSNMTIANNTPAVAPVVPAPTRAAPQSMTMARSSSNTFPSQPTAPSSTSIGRSSSRENLYRREDPMDAEPQHFEHMFSSSPSKSSLRMDAREPAKPINSASVGRSGMKELNMDMINFVQSTQHRAPHPMQSQSSLDVSSTLPPPRSEEELVDTLFHRHHSYISLLSHRLAHLRQVRNVWGNGGNGDDSIFGSAVNVSSSDLKRALEILSNVNDDACFIDFCRVILLKPKVLNLDCAVTLLNLLKRVFTSDFEDFLSVACELTKLIAKSFAEVILSTLETVTRVSGSGLAAALASPGVDVSRDERIEKCYQCYMAFRDIAGSLQVGVTKRVSVPLGTLMNETLMEVGLIVGS